MAGTWDVPVELKASLTKPAANSSYQPIFLFNIKEDPLEMIDLSETYPDKVEELLHRLQYYKQTSVPVYYPPCDKSSVPSNHSGFWIPWAEKDWKHFIQIAK